MPPYGGTRRNVPGNRPGTTTAAGAAVSAALIELTATGAECYPAPGAREPAGGGPGEPTGGRSDSSSSPDEPDDGHDADARLAPAAAGIGVRLRRQFAAGRENRKPSVPRSTRRRGTRERGPAPRAGSRRATRSPAGPASNRRRLARPRNDARRGNRLVGELLSQPFFPVVRPPEDEDRSGAGRGALDREIGSEELVVVRRRSGRERPDRHPGTGRGAGFPKDHHQIASEVGAGPGVRREADRHGSRSPRRSFGRRAPGAASKPPRRRCARPESPARRRRVRSRRRRRCRGAPRAGASRRRRAPAPGSGRRFPRSLPLTPPTGS